MLIEESVEADAMDEVIDEGKRPYSLALKGKASVVRGLCLSFLHSYANVNVRWQKVKCMAKKSSLPVEKIAQGIDRVRAKLAKMDLVCSGTLSKRMMTCGKSTCRCHDDPDAKHGPYYQWGHMKEGKLIHRYVSEEQASDLYQAISNYREIKKLLRVWEAETERLIDAKYPR